MFNPKLIVFEIYFFNFGTCTHFCLELHKCFRNVHLKLNICTLKVPGIYDIGRKSQQTVQITIVTDKRDFFSYYTHLSRRNRMDKEQLMNSPRD